MKNLLYKKESASNPTLKKELEKDRHKKALEKRLILLQSEEKRLDRLSIDSKKQYYNVSAVVDHFKKIMDANPVFSEHSVSYNSLIHMGRQWSGFEKHFKSFLEKENLNEVKWNDLNFLQQYNLINLLDQRTIESMNTAEQDYHAILNKQSKTRQKIDSLYD